MQGLQRRSLQDQLLEPGLDPFPLGVLQVGRGARDCGGERNREGRGRGRRGVGQCGVLSCGTEEQMRRDSGKDEERQSGTTAQMGQDRGRNDLPGRLREDVNRLNGAENGGQDGGV